MLRPPLKSRRTEDLRKGRVSMPGARYFLTWCTANRASLLTQPALLATARQAIAAIDSSGDGTLLAASIMPDHIHLLLQLGERLSVSQVVGKAKSAISRADRAVKWQENFFEQRLRPDDAAESFAFYIFMNPYCANLCRLEQTWPGWIPSSTVRWEFESKMRVGGLPQPEWIEQAERFGDTIPRGADSAGASTGPTQTHSSPSA